MASQMNLPPGFELDEQPKMNLPEGFELDSGAPAPAAPPAMSRAGFGQAVDMVKQSPMFKSLTNPTNLLNSAPDAMRNLGAKAGNFVSENLAKPLMRKNPFNNQMYNANPIPPEAAAAAGFATSLAPDVAMTVGAPGVLEGQFEGPQFIGRWGARQVNNAAGIQSNTIAKMAGRENPARVGESVGRKLAQEGGFGMDAGSTWDKANAVMNKYGGDVQTAIASIKSTGQPVALDAETALQPLVDAWTEKAGSSLQANRALAKPFEEIYGKLSQSAQQNGGQLTLDDLKAAMDETGAALGAMGKESPKQAAYSQLYAKLADTRDQMVSAIAQKAGNPELRDALLKANEGYSRYSRIMPDIRKASARTSVGGTARSSEGGLWSRAIDMARPIFAKAAVKIGGTPAPATGGSALTPAVLSTPEEIAAERRTKPAIPLQMVLPVRPKARPLFRKAS